MRKYNRNKHSLERIENIYPNLYRDKDGVVISESITWFTLENRKASEAIDGILLQMEAKVKEYCPRAEIVYQDASGNRWVFLIFNGNPSKDELMQMQKAYEAVYDPEFIKWRRY